MLPKAQLIEDIAMWDPVAAYGILTHIPQIPFFASAKAVFTSFVVNGIPIAAALDTTVSSRVWIQDMRYSVYQPNVFAGNVFKTQYDAYLRQAPGVDVRLTVHSGPRYTPAINPTPLENVADTFVAIFPSGWPLFKQQSIQCEFTLTQPPPAVTPNGPPYNVCLTFRGFQFLDHTLDEMDPNVAAELLRQAGFKVPAVAMLGSPRVQIPGR